MTSLALLKSGQLAGARRLDLSEGLREVPREVYDLADTLEVLNLTGNQLDQLPQDLHRLTRLRVLFCSDNAFTRLPDCLGECPALTTVGFKANRIDTVPEAALPQHLRWLILTDNRITALPGSLGDRPALEKLMLAGNRLTALPASLQQCRELALLRMSANAFDALPPWLLDMPRLAWLAYGGNPMTQAQEQACAQAAAVPAIPWASLSMQASLGEGASGVIHRALLEGPGTDEAVAVKLFKGHLTSDGLPASEMAAWLAAGQHAGLIPVKGRVTGHPQGKPGVVMPLVDPSFEPLAGPPSLDSCSRDVYPPGRVFAVGTALRLAQGVAKAVAHLHQRGILHGDVYAHNTLWRTDGEALLGDFGAASFLPSHDAARSSALQRLEARAFGCLLQELTTRCQPATPAEVATLEAMGLVQAACVDVTPALRPSFEHIAAALDTA